MGTGVGELGRVASPRALTAAALIGLAVNAFVLMVEVVVNLDRIDLVGELERRATTIERADFSDTWIRGLSLLETAAYLVAGVAFVAWFHRMYKNLGALGSPPRFSSGWAVGAWFVPFLNLVRPKQMADEIWRGANPSTRSTGLVSWWWAAFLVHLLLVRIAGAVGQEETLAAIRTSAIATVLACVAGIVAVTLGIAFVQLTGASGFASPWRVTAVAGTSLLLGLSMGGAVAGASLVKDDGASPVDETAGADSAETGDITPVRETLDPGVVTYIDNACSTADAELEALAEPEDFGAVVVYFESVVAAVSTRADVLANAPVPETARHAYDVRFLDPVKKDVDATRAAVAPVVEAARAEDGTALDAALAAMPETLGIVPSASLYASEVGASACEASFGSS